MKPETMSWEDTVAILDFLGSTSKDPLTFVKLAFPWGEPGTSLEHETGPDEWQAKKLEDIGRKLREGGEPSVVIREAVASGHGIGKSALIAWLIEWAISTHEDTRGVVTANTDTQLRTKTWAELAKWHNMFIAKDLFTLTATSIFSNQPGHDKTWRIDAIPWSESNPEAFAGLHNQGKRLLILFDEASAIADKIWEVIDGATTDRNTEIVWCAFGNPTRNVGRFHDCFYKLRNLWHSIHIDSRSCKQTNKATLQALVDTYGEDSDIVRVRLRGLFPKAADSQFISLELVEAAMQRTLNKTSYEFAPVVLGVDPAYDGADDFVIFLRQGLYSKCLGVWPKTDDDAQMAQIVAGFEDQYHADAVFIDKGYGTGLASFGKVMGRQWTLIAFSSTDLIKEGYLNKRASMWGDMKQWLIDGGAIEDDEKLRDDLIGPIAWVNEKGLIQLEKKADMKKRGVPSPNRADALALTFAMPVIPDKFNTKFKAAKRAGRIRKAGSM